MKTTLIIDDGIMQRLKKEAVKQKRTISDLVESALRLLLDQRKDKKNHMPELKTFRGGRALVDVSNREALYQAMED